MAKGADNDIKVPCRRTRNPSPYWCARVSSTRVSKLLHSTIQPAAQEFLDRQQLAVVSSIAANGCVWASSLTGEPGFIQAVTAQTVLIKAASITGDPFAQNLLAIAEIGILVIDLATRRRLRLNGKAEVRPDGAINLNVRQAYFNPKYIQARQIEADVSNRVYNIQHARTLTENNSAFIAQADIFFIAFHTEGGADVSHPGGNSGFIRVLNANELVFPDYSGNDMFQTLGNISVKPHAGLLFIDFKRGSILQVTGKAYVLWDAACITEFPGVKFQIDQVIEIAGACLLRWNFVEYSPFNPA